MNTALINQKNYLSLTGGLNPGQSLESYIHFANQVPMLKEAEEKQLTERLHQHRNLDAAQRLIMPHLRFVIKIARGFSGYGLQMADLIQEGNIGLMKAVKRFDPTVGVRLVSFAVHWVKAEMHEYIIKNWRIVKIATTKAQRKLFFNLRNSKKRLGWFSQEEINDVAQTLNVKPQEVLEMEKRLNAHDFAFDAPSDSDNDEAFAPAQFLTGPESDPEHAVADENWEDQQNASLYDALAQLNARSQDIVKQRWLSEEKATLHALAAKHQISAERVRQIEAQAMQILKGKLAA